MPRVLLLARTTGYQTRAFGAAAERLGVELVYATDRCTVLTDPWEDGALPVRFGDAPASVAAIARKAATAPLDGVLAVGDQPTVLAATVCRELGLPWHGPEAALAAGNKLMTRRLMQDAGLPVPRFIDAPVTADARDLAARLTFPCVVKPLELSGSRGVIRVDDEAGLAAALRRLRPLLQSAKIAPERTGLDEAVLIEDFVPGPEFAVEGLMTRGTLEALAVFDKPDPLDGPFFEETIYVTPSAVSARTRQAIVSGVARAAHAIGLTHGPIHAECRVNDRGVFVLEVAARPIGGLCSRALRFVTDSEPGGRLASLEELLLRHAMGEPRDGWQRERAASGVMMIPIPRRGVFRRVSGLEAARAVRAVDHVSITAKPDQVLVPLPEGASYLGFIFARAGDPREVERALRQAHAHLEFAIDPELRVLQSAHG